MRVAAPANEYVCTGKGPSPRSRQSAEIVVPILLEYVQPTSVVDVGCGGCDWLRVFLDHGATSVLGLDGHYVDPSGIAIPRECFRAVDLSDPFDVPGPFDLAVSIEVAEHLPARAARPLVRALSAAAPVVLFSAAVPGQGGRSHMNEQWPLYWRNLFAEQGYTRLDPIRPRIWRDTRVAWWYRQNLFLFVSAAAIAQSPALQAEARLASGHDMELLQTDVFSRLTSLRGLVQHTARAAMQAVRRRMPI
jgi:SAM-dependent methyltransferase